MIWLVRATRLTVVLILPVVTGLAAGLMRGRTAPVPSLLAASLAPAPVAAMLALIPGLAVVWGWSGVPWASWAAAGRRTSALLVLALVVAVSSYAVCSWWAGGLGGLLESLRNAGGLAGLALIGLGVRGEAGAVMVPLGYLLLAYLVGRAPGSPTPAAWAWVLADGGSTSALVSGLALFALGLVTIPRLPAAMMGRS